MSILKIKKIKEALSTLNVPVFHYIAEEKSNRYVVWAEDMESSSSNFDNRKKSQAIQGTIDLFTKIEYDSVIDEIQERINTDDISFRLNSIQYEEETGYIHYEWLFEVI